MNLENSYKINVRVMQNHKSAVQTWIINNRKLVTKLFEPLSIVPQNYDLSYLKNKKHSG